MKVHFIGSAEGNRADYQRIAACVHQLEHQLVTNHHVVRTPEQIKSESPEEAELFVKKFQTWHKSADLVVAEVTTPDISIGYEIAHALTLGKPTIVLYRQGINVPAGVPGSLKGMHNERLQVLTYDDTTLEEILGLALEYAAETSDIRFNFFVTPAISAYLDWVAKQQKIPRSVYLRNLIERDMQQNTEYEGRFLAEAE